MSSYHERLAALDGYVRQAAMNTARAQDDALARYLRDESEYRRHMDTRHRSAVERAAIAVERGTKFDDARKVPELAKLIREAVRAGASMALVIAEQERKRQAWIEQQTRPVSDHVDRMHLDFSGSASIEDSIAAARARLLGDDQPEPVARVTVVAAITEGWCPQCREPLLRDVGAPAGEQAGRCPTHGTWTTISDPDSLGYSLDLPMDPWHG